MVQLMVSAGITGYEGAVERYQGVRAVKGADETALFIPLAEALWWAYAIDDLLRGGRSESTDYARSSARDRQLFSGMRFVRNVAGHDLASVLSFQSGLSLPFLLPARLSDFRWRPLSELPSRPKDLDGRTAYVERLTMRDVHQTLETVLAWFRSDEFRRLAD